MGSCACVACTSLCEVISRKTSLPKAQQAQAKSVKEVYYLGEELGSGSGGTLWKARHKISGKYYAVKRIRRAYINNEVAILRTMTHPNVLKLHETFVETTYTYLVTALCRGGDLRNLIDEEKYLEETLSSTLTRQLLHAVDYMHKHSVCHRDLKPENLMLTRKSNPLQVVHLKVIDFGLARTFVTGEKLTSCVGTHEYAAPEVFRCCYTQRCDMWSCGLIVYDMLSGSLPWGSDQESETCAYNLHFDGHMWEEVSEAPQELIGMLLQINAVDRLTAEQALQHNFVLPNFS